VDSILPPGRDGLRGEVPTMVELSRAGAAQASGSASAAPAYIDLVEYASDLIQSVDPDGHILFTNRAWRAALGYEAADLAGRTIFDLIHPAYQAHCREIFAAIWVGTDPGLVEVVLRAKDGHEVPLEGTITCVRRAGGAGATVGVWRDISKRREAEEVLRRSEEKYRQERDFTAAIFDAVASPMVVLNSEGIVRRINRACEQVTGYSRAEVIGRTLWDFVGSHNLSEAARLRAAFESGRVGPLPTTYEDTWIRPDGRRRLISWLVSGIADTTGRLEYIITTGTDITEARQWQDALRLSEERFRNAFENAVVGMALVAPDGRWLRVNRALCRIVGYSEPELLARDFQSITHQDDLSLDLNWARQLLAGKIETFQLEKRYIHRQGHAVWVLISVSLMRDGNGQPLYFIAEIQDITARKRAEDAQQLLVEAGAALSSSIDFPTTLGNVARLIVRSLADYCVIDLVEDDGQVRRVAGVHRDPARQGLVDELVRYHPRPDTENAVALVIRTRAPLLLPEITDAVIASGAGDARQAPVLRALGATSCMIVPLESRAGVIGAISLLLADHGRRYSGADLGLVTEIARRAALALENARLYQQAREALASRDALLSVVSHDIRNDLITIGAFATMLPDFIPRDGTAGAAQLREGLGNIKAAADQMNHLVQDLLDFARLQAGQPLNLDRQPTDLVALAQQVAAEQQRTTGKHQIVVAADQAAVVGLWDQARLARVLVNLLSNAIKYSPAGGEVRVSVGRQEDAAGAWAVLAVQDHGVGIPPDDLPHIFTRFTRARNVQAIKGLGLGLFSVQQIVEQHGGTVTVASEEGRGSVFTVRLPLTEPDRPPAGDSRGPGRKRARK
jgi:PAS domain S-box-containing protein